VALINGPVFYRVYYTRRDEPNNTYWTTVLGDFSLGTYGLTALTETQAKFLAAKLRKHPDVADAWYAFCILPQVYG